MVLLRSKAATSPKPRASSPVPLHWLGFADADPSSTYTFPTRLPVGSAFGLPWAEGEVDKTTAVKATADDGTDVPLQTWPAAYWPSGTLKWTGHALPANIAPSSVTISLGTPPEPTAPVSLTQDASANTITIKTGSFSVVLSTSGNTLVQSLSLDGAEKANGGKLVFHVQDGPDVDLSDVGDPDPDPTGVGRSYEFVIEAWGPGSSADGNAAPSRDEVAGFGKDWSIQPQLVADPEFYAAHKLFGGHWAPPSGAAPNLESRKDALLNFYVNEVEQRRWYGFWDYGDVQHTYDQTRHEWRYDTGGYAWDNGELGTDLWLWLSFMRTGRADVFHRARALTRHLAETDFHHTGTFAGLGSRHNVSHWGDGAKEARVGSAWLKRPFFYLTTDELTGDHMRAALQADESIVKWEPLRKILAKPDPGPGRVRIGPDWTALAGNWWCEWERGNDDYYLNRIKTGMHDIGEMKYGMWSGYTAAVNWDPATGHLQDIGGEFEATYHLSMLFGGGEFLMEAMDLITDEPDFDTKWVEFCQYFNASADEKQAKYGVAFNSGGFEQLYAKLQAYAGERLGDDSLKQAAWQVLNTNTVGVWDPEQQVGGSDVLVGINEIPNLATNDAAARSLAEYAVLEIAPELAPASFGTRSAKSSARPRSEVASHADWDQSTIAGSVRGKDIYDEKDRRVHDEKKSNAKGKGKAWKRLLCIG